MNPVMNTFLSLRADVTLLLALLLISLFSTARAQTVIAATGDSITSGYPEVWCGRGYQSGGYTPYLQSLLDDAGRNSVVHNYGIGGEYSWLMWQTGSGGYCAGTTWYNGQPIRNNQVNVALARSPKPDYVLVLIGTNDLFIVSPGTVASNIQTIVRIIKNAGSIPIVGTLLPHYGSGKAIETVNNWIRYDLAPAENIVVADLYNAAYWAPLLYDGLHPLGAGRQVMANTWYEALLEAGLGGSAITGAIYLLLLAD